MGYSPIDLALRCYPKWWTERYGEEMRAVIDDLKREGRSETSIATGLARDALRAHLQARGMPRTYGLLANRTTSSVAAGTLPWLAIVPFVLAITGRFVLHPHSTDLLTGFPFTLSPFRTKLYGGFHTVYPAISGASWVIGICVMVIQLLFVLTLMILGIGLNVLRIGIMRERRRNRWWMYVMTWVPAITVLVIVGLYLAQYGFNQHGFTETLRNGHLRFVGGHPAWAALMGNLMWVVAISGWVISMVGLVKIANRVKLPPETLRLGRTVSVLTAISLSVTFAAFVVWGLALDVQSRQPHAAGMIVATAPRHDFWLPMVFVLGLACVSSICAANVARRSWATIRTNRLWDT